MPYNSTFRLHSIISTICRTLKQNQNLQHLIKRTPSRYYSLDYLNIYSEDKYDDLRKRLAAVPHLNLLYKNIDRIHKDLCYEEDERLKDVLNWCSKIFKYNATKGKMIRSAVLLKAYCAYGFELDDADWNQWESDGWKSAIILAWCIELTKTYMLMVDDIMDESVLRKGEPCWHRKPEIGLRAVNDCLMLQCGVYKLLEKYLSTSKCYTTILHDFLKVTRETVYGQCIDMMFTSKLQKPRYETFTFEKYETLVEYKSTDLTFSLPLRLSMYLAGKYTKSDFDFADKLCVKIGLYYQAQDDFLDCFGDPEITGKFGNDIREGKCTWFSVKFFEEAPPSLKKQFLENYGIDDKEAISKVVELYKKVHLLERFEEFEDQIFAEISALVKSTKGVKEYFFCDLLAQVRKRED